MNHDAPVSVTRKASAATPADPAPAAARPRTAGGFWAFLRTLFIGSAGLALLAVLGTLAGSAWLTANQRAEADKPQPWADPSFTTTAVTTGGMLARFMDADGDLSNGHSYVKGIYDLWKVKQQPAWNAVFGNERQLAALPQLWQIEISADAETIARIAAARAKASIAATQSHIQQSLANQGRKNFDLATKKESIDATIRSLGIDPRDLATR